MLDPSDPRASLPSYGTGTGQPALQYARAEFATFYDTEPQESSGDAKTWWLRGQNFVLAFSRVTAGARLVRKGQPDEYLLLLCDKASSVNVTTGERPLTIDGYTLTIVPPGDSDVTVTQGGRLIRVFSSQSTDLLERCSNSESYGMPHPNVAPLVPWPAPVGGYKLRSYSLDVPHEPGRHGRIFRCSTLMVNYVDVYDGPRDTTKLSPHSHEDFEQCSLLLDGEIIHHVRFPWNRNLQAWIDDEHVRVGAPSVAIFPPPCIHTSMATGAGLNQLVDIFSPPRRDWSEKPGWVLNADEYPMSDR